MIASEILEGALAKLDNGNAWAKGWYAFDAEGNRVYGDRSDQPKAGPAVKYCAAGAMRAFVFGSVENFYASKFDDRREKDTWPCVNYLGFDYVQANDDPATEWPAVEAMFKAAIAKAKLAEAAA